VPWAHPRAGAWVARERQRGQASPDREPARAALEEPNERPQQANGEHRGDERDQSRQEEEQHARATLVRELIRVPAAPEAAAATAWSPRGRERRKPAENLSPGEKHAWRRLGLGSRVSMAEATDRR